MEGISKVKVSCVKYSNSMLFLHGLKTHPVSTALDIQLDHPSECALKLENNKVDVGLVPVASLINLPEYHIISEYCIGSNNNVDSVLLLSDVPMHEIKTILLDYQSVTSIKLVQILVKHFWKINPIFKNGNAGYETMISDSTAGVVIGDRALQMKKDFKYAYDLSAEWNKFTGLPFVFACWVSNKVLSDDFVTQFNQALELGINSIDLVIDEIAQSGKSKVEIENYLKNNLNFNLSADAKEGMKLFLSYAKEIELNVIDSDLKFDQ